jgi:dipeptide transport system permease protein
VNSLVAALARRGLTAAATFFGITLLTFLLVHMIPGDPVQMMAGARRLDPAFHAEMMHRLGLDRSLPEQYGHYLWQALHLDLGRSIVTQASVWDEFKQLFPATVELALAALLIALTLGVPAGIWAAVRFRRLPDRAIGVLAMLSNSMPIFWWGLLAIMVFAVGMQQWAPGLALPVAGRIGLDFDVAPRTGFMLIDAALSEDDGAWRSALSHLLLPACVLATAPTGMMTRITRASMLEVLQRDYIRTARAKGLRELVVVGLHALRNALLPLLTVAGLLTATLLGGAVFTETVFSWPGVGKWLIDAIGRRDYPVLQGGVLIAACLVIAVNMLVDGLYELADPRLRRR